MFTKRMLEYRFHADPEPAWGDDSPEGSGERGSTWRNLVDFKPFRLYISRGSVVGLPLCNFRRVDFGEHDRGRLRGAGRDPGSR